MVPASTNPPSSFVIFEVTGFAVPHTRTPVGQLIILLVWWHCYSWLPARLACVVALGLPHHVTRRGDRSQPIFFEDSDNAVCGDPLGERTRKAQVEVWAYFPKIVDQRAPRRSERSGAEPAYWPWVAAIHSSRLTRPSWFWSAASRTLR